jgi:plastocyanin
MIASPRATLASTLLLLGPLLLAGCGDDDDNGGTTPDTTGDIRVSVTADGSGVAGVTVNISGTASGTQTTGSDGSTTFGDLEPGDYDVAITVPDGHVLDTGESDTQSVTVVAGETADADFGLVEEGEEGVQEINLLASSFSPSTVDVPVGTVVRWVNTQAITHTITPDGHTEWGEQSITQDGQEFEHTFDTAGTYEYLCTVHAGMTGTVTVSEP